MKKNIKKLNKVLISKSLIAVTLSLTLIIGFTPINTFAVTPPDRTFGITSTYSVYGHAGITNTGVGTRVWGNVGDNNVGHSGFTAVQVPSGIIDITTASGTAIENDASSVYDSLMDASQGTPTALDLAGTHTIANGNPITPGVYTVGATTLNGAVELSGAGVYIFRSDSSSTIATSGGAMTLLNGATPCNVFWAIPASMTIGTGSHIEGTIIAHTGLISLGTGASLVGRAISLVAQVTLDDNQITEPTCFVAPTPGLVRQSVVPLPMPLINVTKIPSPLALPLGPGSVTYTYTVTNIGKVAMDDVWVKDNKCSAVNLVSGDTNNDKKLDLNEIWKYNCTKTVSLTETNTATAHGAANNGEVWDTANATIVVGVPLIPPLIHLIKFPNLFTLPFGGGVVTYTYNVTNPGTEPLSDVSITDDKCTGLPGRVVGHPGDLNKNNLLESNEMWTFTCQTNLKQTTTNIGTAIGHANGLTALDFSPATVVVSPIVPKLPKTGFGPNNTPWNIIIVVGTLTLITTSILVLRKRKV